MHVKCTLQIQAMLTSWLNILGFGVYNHFGIKCSKTGNFQFIRFETHFSSFWDLFWVWSVFPLLWIKSPILDEPKPLLSPNKEFSKFDYVGLLFYVFGYVMLGDSPKSNPLLLASSSSSSLPNRSSDLPSSSSPLWLNKSSILSDGAPPIFCTFARPPCI